MIKTLPQGATYRRHSRPPRLGIGSRYPLLLFTACLALTLLGVLIGASQPIGTEALGAPEKSVLRSALVQTPDCECLGGISVDPIASAVPGTMTLECEGWRIGNTDTDPLVIRSVTINHEYLAPLGSSARGHIRRHRGQHYPITIRSGESASIFGYALGDPASYTNQVRQLVLDTNRGKFRYTPSGGLEQQ